MKPLAVVVTIIGASVVLVFAASVKSKIDRGRKQDLIKSRVAALHRIGFTTSRSEYDASKVPSKSDAWWDIEALMTKPINYEQKQFDAKAFIFAATKQDLPSLKKYLVQGESSRAVVLKAIQQNKTLKIKETIFGSPANVEMRMDRSTRDFVVAAIAAALEGDRTGVRQNLAAARYLANALVRETSTVFGGTSWRSTIYPGALKIMELVPSMTDEIENFLNQPQLIADFDVKAYYSWTFFLGSSSILALDSPIIDRINTPKWLRWLVHTPNGEDISKASTDKKDGYVPASDITLSAYREMLDRWTPVLEKANKNEEPTKAELAQTYAPFSGVPKEVSDLVVPSMDSEISWTIDEFRNTKTVKLVIGQVLKIKKQTGSFPENLDAFLAASKSKNVNYTRNVDGFLITSSIFSPSANKMIVLSKIIYPPARLVSGRKHDAYRQLLDQVLAGKLSVINSETNAKKDSSGNRGPAGSPAASK